MAYPTLGSIIQNVIVEAGLVSGSAVQTYTEPQIIVACNRMFNFLFQKQKWDHLWWWETKTLDGVTGKPTTAFDSVTQYEDIAEMRMSGTNGYKIVEPVDNEHLSLLSGSEPVFRKPLPWTDTDADTKFVAVYPVTAVGDVDYYCGHRPAEFSATADKVPFDKTVIELGTLWYLLAGDGINPANAEKAQIMFDVAFQDYQARMTKEIGQNGGYRNGRTVTIR